MTVQRFYIYGYYGSKNAGDEAFRLAFKKLLPSQAELLFIRPSELAGNTDLSDRIHTDVSTGTSKLIVGGGAIIGEPYFWAHLPANTPYHIISADIGSQENLITTYRASLNPLQRSWIRSEKDSEQLDQLTNNSKDILYLPDIVFCLSCNSKRQAAITGMNRQERNIELLQAMQSHCENSQPESQLRNKNMAIFLSDHYYDYRTIHSSCILDGIERAAADTIHLRQLRQSLDEITAYYNLYFFSLSFWYNSIDFFVGYRMAKASSHAPLYNLVSHYIAPATIIELMPYFDAAISTKFHGLILPMTANVPVLNLGTSKKNKDLCQQMGILSLPPEQLNVNSFLAALKQVESLEYATSLAETRRLATESILTAFAEPGLWSH